MNIKEEYQKCVDNPLYWYNNYCTINGKKVTPLTQEQWDARLSEIEYQRHKRCRNPEAHMLKTPDDAYLPNFLKKTANEQ